jgi:hypothetical protein
MVDPNHLNPGALHLHAAQLHFHRPVHAPPNDTAHSKVQVVPLNTHLPTGAEHISMQRCVIQ